MKYIALIAFHVGNVLFFIFSLCTGILLLLGMESTPILSILLVMLIPIWVWYSTMLTKIKTAPHGKERIRYQFQTALLAWGSIFVIFSGCIYLISFSG